MIVDLVLLCTFPDLLEVTVCLQCLIIALFTEELFHELFLHLVVEP